MSVVMIDITFGLLVAMVGAIAGWFLRGRDADGPALGDRAERETRFAQEVLTRLQTVAADVAAGVGEHNSRVEEISEELSAGNKEQTDVVVDAVDKLLKANSRMQEQLESADEKLIEQARQIESHATEARTDPLTGLANRRAFDDEMARRLAEFKRHGRGVSIMMADIDHFKQINDTHGHLVGDEVLRDLAGVLRRTARITDTVVRYGGEEFAAVMPGVSSREAAEGAERLRQAIENHRFFSGETQIPVTASFGVAELRKKDTMAAVIEQSDQALYAAKESGRNRVFWNDRGTVRPLGEEPTSDDTEDTSPQTQGPAVEAERAEAGPPQDRLEPAGVAEEIDRIVEGDLIEPPSGPAHYYDGSCDRAGFQEFVAGQLRRHADGPDRPSVVLVQVDNHADLVAELGGEAGLMILRATPKFLKAAFRDMQMLARYDSATYAVALGGAEIGGVIARAERMREAVTRCELPFGGKPMRFSVSVSVAEAHRGDNAAQLLGNAEEALEAATKSGGNSTYFHNGQWSETAGSMMEQIG